MTFDQLSSSDGGGCDIEAIRRFWDGMLQRLKIRAELAELEAIYASGADQNATGPSDGDEKQTGQRE
jgi:hypothetical protein